jgi:hypothetical protein
MLARSNVDLPFQIMQSQRSCIVNAVNQDEDRPVADFVLSKQRYQILQAAYCALSAELQLWNRKALEGGAAKEPFEQEVNDLNSRIEWGNQELVSARFSVRVTGMSIRSFRYAKAALLFHLSTKKQEIEQKKLEGWPERVIRALNESVASIEQIEQEIAYPSSDFLWELITQKGINSKAYITNWDVFISHASEDKDGFVRPLAIALQSCGLKVWYDEFTLKVGDSLRRSIDRGLINSKYGIVVISPNFLNKEWPRRELDGLVSLEVDGRKVILPVWHNIDFHGVKNHSPTLADRVAVLSSIGIERVAATLIEAIKS